MRNGNKKWIVFAEFTFDVYIIPSIILHDCAGCAGIDFRIFNFHAGIRKIK